jgi:hypothetical protein
MDKKCKLLEAGLRGLSLDEVRSFHAHFYECLDRAYTWELWAAAYIIGGGCSDDKFSDFRSTLVSMGRQIFERTLANPESLADMDYDADTADYEGYQYVPSQVERELAAANISRGHALVPRNLPVSCGTKIKSPGYTLNSHENMTIEANCFKNNLGVSLIRGGKLSI